MATSTALGYNTGSTITGTQQIGNLVVVTATTANPSSDPNGVKFWMGPDQELGYVIGIPVSAGNQSTPVVGVTAFVGFNRSSALTESSFVIMVNNTFNQSFTGGTQAATYLNNNGYWTSYYERQIPYIYGEPQLVFDFSSTKSYANSGTSIADLSGNGRNGTFSTGTGNGVAATVTGYNANGYLNLPGTSAQRSVRIPDTLKPGGTANFTYIVYMRPKGYSYNGSFPGIIAMQQDGSGTGFGWIIQAVSPVGQAATRNNTNSVSLRYSGGAGLNVWSVYAIKFNGVSTTLYQYYNGVLYTANTVGATSITTSTGWGIFLGLRYNMWINADFNYVSMYNTALTDSEITTIAQQLTTKFPA